MSKRMDEIDKWIEHDLKMRDIKAWVCLSLASAFCILGLTFGFSGVVEGLNILYPVGLGGGAILALWIYHQRYAF